MPQVNLQDLYDEIQKKKDERKIIKSSIKDHYDTSPTFKNIKEALDLAKNKKKAYDAEVREAFGKDFDQMMNLSNDISADEDLLSDLCFQELMKNNPVELKDDKGRKYQPVIKVAFKKM